MGIYSVSGGSSSTIKLDRTYSMTDCGRIMCESAVNDQNLFAAVLTSDYNEAIGLYEGTLLHEEVEEKNKKDGATLIKKITDAFQKLLKKIRDLYDSAISKMMVLLVDCKRDRARWDKIKDRALANKNWTVEKCTFKADDAGDTSYLPDVLSKANLEAMAKDNNGQKASNMKTVSTVLDKVLDKASVTKKPKLDDINRSTFKKAMLDKRFTTGSVNYENVEKRVVGPMDANKDVVKNLMKQKRDVSDSINKYVSELKKDQKNSEKDQRLDTAAIMRASSVFQSALNIIINTHISMCFYEVSCSRKNLAKVISAVTGADKVNEAFVLQEIDDRTDEIMSDLPGVDGDENPEVREEFADEIKELSESGFVFCY